MLRIMLLNTVVVGLLSGCQKEEEQYVAPPFGYLEFCVRHGGCDEGGKNTEPDQQGSKPEDQIR